MRAHVRGLSTFDVNGGDGVGTADARARSFAFRTRRTLRRARYEPTRAELDGARDANWNLRSNRHQAIRTRTRSSARKPVASSHPRLRHAQLHSRRSLSISRRNRTGDRDGENTSLRYVDSCDNTCASAKLTLPPIPSVSSSLVDQIKPRGGTLIYPSFESHSPIDSSSPSPPSSLNLTTKTTTPKQSSDDATPSEAKSPLVMTPPTSNPPILPSPRFPATGTVTGRKDIMRRIHS